MENPLNRRGFIRLCMVAAGGAVVAACQQSLQQIATATAVLPTSTPKSITNLRLLGADQDVWTWVKPVTGAVSGECQSLVVDINGSEFEAQLQSEAFKTDVTLSSGMNRVSAVCKQLDEVEIRSNMLNYTERL